MKNRRIRFVGLLCLLFIISSCASQPSSVQRAAATPSPTIASLVPQVVPIPQPSPLIQVVVATPTSSTLGQPTATTVIDVTAVEYLWPSYLPTGLQVSAAESRVSAMNELGPSGFGFYIVTLNGKDQKVTIGGGDLQGALPLSGEEQDVVVGTRKAKLITTGERRELVFDGARGTLFVYVAGLSEAELLKIAESLYPVELQSLRDLVGS